MVSLAIALKSSLQILIRNKLFEKREKGMKGVPYFLSQGNVMLKGNFVSCVKSLNCFHTTIICDLMSEYIFAILLHINYI